jgi:L-ascorbate metabolism protein UlaG (beta-lactamase superfamily)
MVITYFGAEFFKVQFGDITLAFNPISKDSKIKPSRFGADVVLVSAYHEDFNGVDQVTHGDKKPFVISGPGEYEVKGVFIKGLASESGYGLKKDEKSLVNTIYTVSLENMNICFLGALNATELKDETVEALDEIDILFVPIGGEGVLDPAKAYKVAVSLEPKLIIPMHYGTPGADVGVANALKTFLKEAGENPTPVAKLTLKKKDLEGKEADVVVLESSKE